MGNQKKLLKSIAFAFIAQFVFGSLAGCSGKKKTEDEIEKLKWLVGSWEMKMPEGLLTETWKPAQNGNLTGESYLVTPGGDTIFSETISLKAKNGKVQYIVTVPDQNKAEAVPFTLISATVSGYIFENKNHDFPKRIIYKKEGENGLTARIEGTQNSKPASQEFSFKRVK